LLLTALPVTVRPILGLYSWSSRRRNRADPPSTKNPIHRSTYAKPDEHTDRQRPAELSPAGKLTTTSGRIVEPKMAAQ